MSNILKRMKKRLEKSIDSKQVEYDQDIYDQDILVHGRMIYECESCGCRWNMYLEKGIEEFDENHKPSPYVIRCGYCGGMARDVSGIIGFAGGGYYPLPKGESYFANREDSDCGVPVLRCNYDG